VQWWEIVSRLLSLSLFLLDLIKEKCSDK
jgi:hypothetical protein